LTVVVSDLPGRWVECDCCQLLGRGGAVQELQLITTFEPMDTPENEGELSWQERALCAQTDPEAFFPEKGGSTRDAKKVCVGCDVRGECLDYALVHDERFGIWGGLSERERRKLKKRAV
jgi:WhiB family redox-sensing transcriptional regulator